MTARVANDQRSLLLANIVEGVDDAIMTKTVDGVVTSWNRASEDLYGYTAAEAIGQSMIDLIVPTELARRARRHHRQAARGPGDPPVHDDAPDTRTAAS